MASISIQDISILLVAPSRVLGAVLSKELGDLGVVQTICCKNITDAIEKMREIKPDLVVSSMYFEDGDGIDLITQMRHETIFEDTLFMLVSSETRFEMLDPIRQAGVVAILPRPFTQDALSQAFQSALGFLEEKQFSSANKNILELKMLVVDDSKLARRHMMSVLAKIGIHVDQVTLAESGHEAVQKLEAQYFDVVLTDYNMPIMDGEELLKFIRQHNALDQLPVIMVTSEQCEIKIASIKSNGVTAMLNKPFDPPNLKDLLESCL
jgi:two-component system chemotaxis response regulator CheY